MIDERLRLSIHTKLTELIGHDEADLLVARIMTVPWHDVATRDDIQIVRHEMGVTRADLRTEIAEVRTELKTEIADVRTELADVRTELKTEIAEVRTELAEVRTELADVRTELKTGLADVRTELKAGLAEVRSDVNIAIVGQTRWLTGFVTALSVVMMGVARMLF